MLRIKCLKSVSEERKPNHDFQPNCCCGARVEDDASALFAIIRMIINAFFVQPIRATRHRLASFLENASLDTARNVSRSPQSMPTCEDSPDYMNMSAQMLRAHASAK